MSGKLLAGLGLYVVLHTAATNPLVRTFMRSGERNEVAPSRIDQHVNIFHNGVVEREVRDFDNDSIPDQYVTARNGAQFAILSGNESKKFYRVD